MSKADELREKAAERFIGKVDAQGGDSACHLWTGNLDGNGYGNFWLNGKNGKAHRFAWELGSGAPVPGELYVLHKCDTRDCCNYKHLFLGTHTDNMRDMQAKGRHAAARVTFNPNAKLTESDVLAIRTATGSQKSIGDRYGVRQTTVSHIKLGITWRHLKSPEAPR